MSMNGIGRRGHTVLVNILVQLNLESQSSGMLTLRVDLVHMCLLVLLLVFMMLGLTNVIYSAMPPVKPYSDPTSSFMLSPSIYAHDLHLYIAVPLYLQLTRICMHSITSLIKKQSRFFFMFSH